MVPVVHDAQSRTLVELGREIARVTEAGRAGHLAPDAIRGATFTVTNFGTEGGRFATPIVRPPQVAILGFGAVRVRPVVDGDAVVAAPTVPISLSADHRVIDGRDATGFLEAVAARLAQPSELVSTSTRLTSGGAPLNPGAPPSTRPRPAASGPATAVGRHRPGVGGDAGAARDRHTRRRGLGVVDLARVDRQAVGHGVVVEPLGLVVDVADSLSGWSSIVARSSTARCQVIVAPALRALYTMRVPSGDSDGHSTPERSTVARRVNTSPRMRYCSPPEPSVA